MMEMEMEKPSAAVASIKTHDSKRFRLRAVSQESDIYQRYFHKSITHNVSLTQLVLAGLIILARFVVPTMLNMQGQMRIPAYSDVVNQGTSWIGTTMSAMAAMVALLACKKPSYVRLHTSMALHIISAFLLAWSCCLVYFTELMEIKNSLVKLRAAGIVVNSVNDTHTSMEYFKSSVPDEKGVMWLYQCGYSITSAMFSGMFLQIMFSVVMAFQTGRAVCCGRTHLEGRFLEMEAVGREDEDAIVNFRVGHRRSSAASIRHQSQCPQHLTNPQDPPPSYVPPEMCNSHPPSPTIQETKE